MVIKSIENLRKTQKKASFFIIAMVMWEFFSYFGLQSILILYLTNHAHFTDGAAYQLYGSFTSLIFITPIIGGWLADRYFGYRSAVAVGCVLIVFGHLILSIWNQHNLYFGLALLTVGIGFFKSNAICLIGTCYPDNPARKTAAFSWYYVSGNLGAIASQIICPYLAERVGWDVGFIAAAIGMMFGILMLFLSRRYFTWTKKIKKHRPLFWVGGCGVVIGLLILTYVALRYDGVGYLLIITSIFSVMLLVTIYRKTNTIHKKALRMIMLLTVFATAFWIFDQQGSSSISLFISRYIHREFFGFMVPTGMFQSISPAMILVSGSIMAFVWVWMGNRGINPRPGMKLSVALFLLMIGFLVIAWGAKIASIDSFASMLFPVIGLMLIGVAEIFVDPILLAAISDVAPEHSEGQLVAIYYLAVGAIANYLAIGVANLTIDPMTHQATALTYHAAYSQIAVIAVVLFVLLMGILRISRSCCKL